MSDDYPTDEDLERVKAWPIGDPRGWFAFIRSIWWMPDWGWHTEDTLDDTVGGHRNVMRHSISTGGWSGNEEVISAMERNFLWQVTWMESRRGGHFVFEVAEALQPPLAPVREQA